MLIHKRRQSAVDAQGLPLLSTVIVSTLWSTVPAIDPSPFWTTKRQNDFLEFCQSFVTQLPPSVVYLGLKYVQDYLKNTSRPCEPGSERHIFVTALRLGFRYLVDTDTCIEPLWSDIVSIPRHDLHRLETQLLKDIHHSLHVCKDMFDQWVHECVDIYNTYCLENPTDVAEFTPEPAAAYYDTSNQETVISNMMMNVMLLGGGNGGPSCDGYMEEPSNAAFYAADGIMTTAPLDAPSVAPVYSMYSAAATAQPSFALPHTPLETFVDDPSSCTSSTTSLPLDSNLQSGSMDFHELMAFMSSDSFYDSANWTTDSQKLDTAVAECPGMGGAHVLHGPHPFMPEFSNITPVYDF